MAGLWPTWLALPQARRPGGHGDKGKPGAGFFGSMREPLLCQRPACGLPLLSCADAAGLLRLHHVHADLTPEGRVQLVARVVGADGCFEPCTTTR